MDVQESFASRTKRAICRVGSPFRFVLSGGIVSLAGYLVYAFLLLFLPYLISYSIAYILGITISYLLSSKFVFNQRLELGKAFKYPLVYLTQYLVGMACLYLLVGILSVNKLLASAFVVLLTAPLTYFMSRRILTGNG